MECPLEVEEKYDPVDCRRVLKPPHRFVFRREYTVLPDTPRAPGGLVNRTHDLEFPLFQTQCVVVTPYRSLGLRCISMLNHQKI